MVTPDLLHAVERLGLRDLWVVHGLSAAAAGGGLYARVWAALSCAVRDLQGDEDPHPDVLRVAEGMTLAEARAWCAALLKLSVAAESERGGDLLRALATELAIAHAAGVFATELSDVTAADFR